MVEIMYFARLREAFGKDHERLVLPEEVADIASLLAFLRSRGGHWEKELAPTRSFRVAINQEMADAQAKVVPGDEIAIFPPVTGG